MSIRSFAKKEKKKAKPKDENKCSLTKYEKFNMAANSSKKKKKAFVVDVQKMRRFYPSLKVVILLLKCIYANSIRREEVKTSSFHCEWEKDFLSFMRCRDVVIVVVAFMPTKREI